MRIKYNSKFRKIRRFFTEMKLLIGVGIFLLSLPVVFEIGGNIGIKGVGAVLLITGLYLANSSEELKNENNKNR